ncbi:hypothetical protein QIH85_43025 [Bradyrhizobium japonicum]|uniref:hypothetical protein n=1 Tax=Bradyrhizobium japonicum TaxID=375 RepID=UPI001E2B3AB6|nr:hypothetical protein [Bradyrhizobium japonicum]MCD9898137.1 hypothetical protein [Bradyrhizobium japonicum]WLB28506.1 hypothetical protein QIH85_43025 [Bradyrhizobium japonicum]WRJ84740.1 hypothetical protein R3F78_07630 [Bradyrhizobium japonicum]WRJ93710.1 hypothetical protein R3F77_05340 [Bradyrhizobium japonicum]WRK47562.1 hypothetical protein R3F73_05400 [Bradyrhizobium japonicum]
MATPRPPIHLSRTAKAWWRQVHDGYDLDEHHRHLLRLACESMDEVRKLAPRWQIMAMSS